MLDKLDQLCQLDLGAASLLPTHPTLCHPRTGDPLRAVGFRHDGRIIWPIIGAADDDGDDDGGDDDEGDDSDDEDDKDSDDEDDEDKPLGRKGEKALEAEKEKRRRARARAAKAEEENERLRDEIERLKGKGKKSGKDDDEDDDDQDDDDRRRDRRRRDDEREAQARADRKIVRAEAKSIAADLGFADPDDAHRYIDLDDFEVDEDGDLEDLDELREALEDVLKRKSHLKGKGRRFGGGADGGPRGDGKKPEPAAGAARIERAYADASSASARRRRRR